MPPVRNNVETSKARGGSPSLEVTGTQNLAVRDLTGMTPPEGAIAGSDRQTHSKGQANPICLGPIDKPVIGQDCQEVIDKSLRDQRASESVKWGDHTGTLSKSYAWSGAGSKVHMSFSTVAPLILASMLS